MRRTAYLLLLGILFFTPETGAQAPELLIDSCATSAGDDATYLKDFLVILPGVGEGERAPIARYPLVLSKNNIYRFSVCSSTDPGGKAVLKLYDSNRMIFSSLNNDTGEEFNPFNFMCQKTGIYHVFISFEKGMAGQAVGILSYVTK